MLHTDIAVNPHPVWFDGNQEHYRESLGKRDFELQSFIYCYKIAKYNRRHTQKVMFIKSKNKYITMKKLADDLRERYFAKTKSRALHYKGV